MRWRQKRWWHENHQGIPPNKCCQAVRRLGATSLDHGAFKLGKDASRAVRQGAAGRCPIFLEARAKRRRTMQTVAERCKPAKTYI